ncbi:MAG: response regulator [Calditrichaeota bacterium]|nr:response regulator [Calditrichota bacterium]
MYTEHEDTSGMLNEEQLAIQQAKMYAEDLSKLYESEKSKRALLELTNTELLIKKEQLEQEMNERKLAESKIREQAMLIDIAKEAIIVCDLDGKVIFWNKGAERIYGFGQDEIIGYDYKLFGTNDYADVFPEAKRTVVKSGEWQGQSRHTRRDKREIDVDSNWTLMLDDNNKPKSILILNSDITEKKKAEAKEFRSQRTEILGQLAGGIAHDLNNILNPIMMATYLLKMTTKDEHGLDLLSKIDSNVTRAADLVKQVLTFARGAEGKQTILQAKHLIKDLAQMIETTFPKSIFLKTNLPTDLNIVRGDPTQLHQVLLNLSINARDAMPNGGDLTIKAKNTTIDKTLSSKFPGSKPGSYIQISVSDTGTGISIENQKKIFDPFFTSKEIGKGTGLGLSIVETIVKNHRGFIDLVSEEGQGTCFKIYIPATIGNVDIQVESQLPVPLGHGELILVADDEAAVREITCESLKAHGYKTISASDGFEAHNLYSKNISKIDILLIDLLMPVMDGAAAIKAITKLNPNVEIIVISGQSKGRATIKKLGLDEDRFLQKPFTIEELLIALDKILHKDQQR